MALARALSVYGTIFGLPILMYAVWSISLRGKLDFKLLLPVVVCAVWLALWPTNYQPEHHASSAELGDRSDSIVTGYIFQGWIYGVIGSLPLVAIEMVRRLLRRERAKKVGQ